MSLPDAAEFLTAQWPVFPCGANKRPVIERGFYAATRDPVEARALFLRPGAALIGVPTGAISDLVVLDFDIKRDANGLAWLRENEHRLPRTRRHRTRSGGEHLLFRHPGVPIRNSAGLLAPGVDVRGDGGYIIVPPSEGYEILDAAMPAEMPVWLVAQLLVKRPEPEPTPPAPEPRTLAITDGTQWGLGALRRACEAIRNAADGTKHATLNREAYSIGGLVTGGDLVEGVARAALADALAAIKYRCDDYRAAERTLADAFKAGMDKPRQPPAPLPPMPPQRMPFGIGEVTSGGVVYDAETGEVIEAPQPSGAGRQDAPAAASVLWIDAGEWDEATIPKRPWLAAGYLMRGAVSALSGQGSGGKSSLTVCWTISLALGDAVGDFRPVGPLKVVNYNVEDDQLEQRRRYSAALKAAGKTPADIGDRIVRCGPETIGTLFERDPVTGRITPTPAMDRLEALCQETSADVLICDPLAELHNAEENDNTAMRAVVAAFRALAKRLNIAVLLLHHDRKGNNAPGDMDRLRGASAITGAVRVLLTLTTMSAEEAERFGIPPDERRRHFRIDGAKSNYAVAQEAEWWRLSGYQLANGEEVAACRPWAPPSPFDGLTMADCVAVLETLQRGTKAGHAWAAAKQAGDDWGGRTLTVQHGLTDAQADAVLGAWLKAGVLSIEPQDGPRRGHPRKAFIVSDQKIAEMRRHKVGDIAPW